MSGLTGAVCCSGLQVAVLDLEQQLLGLALGSLRAVGNILPLLDPYRAICERLMPPACFTVRIK